MHRRYYKRRVWCSISLVMDTRVYWWRRFDWRRKTLAPFGRISLDLFSHFSLRIEFKGVTYHQIWLAWMPRDSNSLYCPYSTYTYIEYLFAVTFWVNCWWKRFLKWRSGGRDRQMTILDFLSSFSSVFGPWLRERRFLGWASWLWVSPTCLCFSLSERTLKSDSNWEASPNAGWAALSSPTCISISTPKHSNVAFNATTSNAVFSSGYPTISSQMPHSIAYLQ